MNIIIGQAEKDDIESICSIDQIAAGSHDRREFVVRSVTLGDCWVADVDGKVVGYTVLDYSFYANGMIGMLFIDPEYRRRGIGTKLVRHIESLCKTEKLFTLSCTKRIDGWRVRV